MAEFMQINLATAPVLLNLKDVKFVSSSATNTITLYYSATDEATVTFSAADATYGLQKWFVGQVKVAMAYEEAGYILPPLPKVPNNDAVIVSSVVYP
jgi:hypothetical protein